MSLAHIRMSILRYHFQSMSTMELVNGKGIMKIALYGYLRVSMSSQL